MSRSRPTSPEFEHSPAGHLGPFAAAVSCRWGGCSPSPWDTLNLGRSTGDSPERVGMNEARVLGALGLADNVARLRLEHGTRVMRAGSGGMYGPADAILTANPDLVLWLTVADCYPLVLTAGGVRILGHCGWRGIAAGLVEAMVAAAVGPGSLHPSAFRAWIGPGIGPCCYPVRPEVADLFRPGSRPGRCDDGSLRIDLAAEIRSRLADCGLRADSVAASGECTACRTDRFFSHRGEDARTGRMAALVWTAGSR